MILVCGAIAVAVLGLGMSLLQCRELRYSPGSAEVLAGVSFAVDQGQRVGLVGTNGCGKSSLLRILGGELEPDSGEVVTRRGASITLVSQFLPEALRAQTVQRVVEDAAREAHRANELLTRLDFTVAQRGQTAGSLSGGEVNRMLLARAVAAEPDLILLDEPTNHLDVETVVAFQRFVTEYVRKAFLLVSHDRALLDALTERTVFLRGGEAHAFDLSYSGARHELLQSEAAALQRRETQQREIDRVRASMKRLKHWAHVYDNEKLARKARSMGKRVERMEASQQAAPWADRRRLAAADSDVRARRLLDVEQTRVSAPDGRVLFEVEGFYLRRGDRVALLGENGSGKSTLLRHLCEVADGNEMREGGVRFNPQAKLGYYDQELSTLDPQRTLLQTLVDCSDQPTDRLRGKLSTAGFPPRSHERAVETLSGGEKSRLLFLVLELTQPNLLLLDEPTNHIDLEGCEALEAELLSGGLTLLFVSHDRRFTESVANRFVCVRGGTLEEVPSLDAYFEQVAPDKPVADAEDATDTPGSPEAGSEGDALARIMELEAKLEADLARKKKHQKPKLQQAWREEIAELYTHLS